MTDKNLSKEEEASLWEQAGQRLSAVVSKPPPTPKLVDRLLAQLPVKRDGETIADLIRRSSAESQSGSKIRSLSPKPTKRFKALTEFVRLAADTSGPEIPLPDPACDLESPDGRFRLNISADNGKIHITVQALGFSADQFANRCIGIAGLPEEDDAIAIFELDQDGDGSCSIEDTNRVRQALLRPVVGLIDDK